MKLWDKKGDCVTAMVGHAFIFLQACPYVLRPLACDVIQDDQFRRCILSEARKEKVVDIHISAKECLVSVHQSKCRNTCQNTCAGTHTPEHTCQDTRVGTHLSPFCRSPTEHGRFMSCRVHSIVTIPVADKPWAFFVPALISALWLLHVDISSSICLPNVAKKVWYLLSSTKYAIPLLRHGSFLTDETFLRFARKFASIPRKSL